jgi:uncharacterized cupin superfamily protein
VSEEMVYLRLPVNLLEVETEGDESDPPGFRARAVRVGPLVGASALGATVYDLEPGESVCPYHYEYGNEEWLIVFTGKPTLRDEDGDEYELKQWDVASFPEGPDGAHKVTNRTDEPVRIAILSTKNEPAIAVYPDSGKIGVWPEGKLFRLADEVEYWEGEIDNAETAE